MAEDTSSKTQGFMKTIVDELRNMARSETVIGEPITVGNATIVPVVKVCVGFGAGGGEGGGEGPSGETGKIGHGQGVGQGGGGGVKIEPVAFLTIVGDDVRLLSVGKRLSMDRWVETVPDVIEAIKGATSKEKAPKK